LRSELHPKGLEIVTVSLEVSGPEASRAYIEAAAPEHPSLLDMTHQMDALFGVVNIPNVVWIDEEGTIVRPPEPGWAGPQVLPEEMGRQLRRTARPKPDQDAEAATRSRSRQLAAIASGQDRGRYPDAIRDWVTKGADSEFAMTPAEVVQRSQPRPPQVSEAAAHFELAIHLWQAGRRDGAIGHFNAAHRLQPGNWTYKRKAWSLVGNERVGGAYGRFVQSPVAGEEESWPFDSDFNADVSALGEGEYYPSTM
jgi:hypothetical protein